MVNVCGNVYSRKMNIYQSLTTSTFHTVLSVLVNYHLRKLKISKIFNSQVLVTPPNTTVHAVCSGKIWVSLKYVLTGVLILVVEVLLYGIDYSVPD